MVAPYSLDGLDRSIIQLLQKSGRATNSGIAQQLSISEGTVRKRIDRLVTGGVITLAAVVHPRQIGFAVVGLVAINTEFGRDQTVAQQIAAMDQVSYVGYSLGVHDLIIQVNCQSVDELNEFVNVRLAHITGIRSTETTIIPRVIKAMHTWLPPLPGTDTSSGATNGTSS